MSNLTLRIDQATAPGGGESLRLTLHQGDSAVYAATAPFSYSIGKVDSESLRWYWEDYLEKPLGQAVGVAGRVQRRLVSIGEELFQAVFSSADAAKLWGELGPRLDDLRIEISTPPPAVSKPLPWELLRDDRTGRWLAIDSRSFARVPSAQPDAWFTPRPERQLRILVAIVRPDPERFDFHSVFRRLMPQLASLPGVEWEVLRPSAFGRLNTVLLEAEAAGNPFHVVHLEGSAQLLDVSQQRDHQSASHRPLRPRDGALVAGPRGYFVFNPAHDPANARLVGPDELGEALIEARVPLLTLTNNAEPLASRRETAGGPEHTGEALRAMAADLVELGVPAVLHFPYRISVDGAAEFLSGVYSHVALGVEISEAVRLARVAARAEPNREIAHYGTRHSDSCAAVLEQAFPAPAIQLPSAQDLAAAGRPAPRLASAPAPRVGKPGEELKLPPPPAAAVPRDTLIFDIDRALEDEPCVLLHGPQGSGKTVAGLELAAWRAETQGAAGPVLYSSFGAHQSIAFLMDHLAAVFSRALEGNGVHWAALDERKQFQAASLILEQIPLLWIWDGFESVQQGDSAWPKEQQEKLTALFNAVTDSQARLVILSRDSEDWLGAAPRRKAMPPWRTREQLQLIRAVCERDSETRVRLDDFDPVIDSAGANPVVVQSLTAICIGEQAGSRNAVQRIVRQVIGADPSRQPADTLRAAVDCLLRQQFNHQERQLLGLCHLFEDCLDVTILRDVARTAIEGSQSAFSDDGNPHGDFLARAERMQLLQRRSKHNFQIARHLRPALECLFDDLHGELAQAAATKAPASAPGAAASSADSPAQASRESVKASVQRSKLAFAESAAILADRLAERARQGDEVALLRLRLNESNLRKACRLAIQRGLSARAAAAARGLCEFYDITNRTAVWAEFVDEVSVDCTDPSTRRNLPGRESLWREITEQYIRVAIKRRSFKWARELQNLVVSWDRQRTEEFSDAPVDHLNDSQRESLRRLAGSLFRLAAVGRDDAAPNPAAEQESIELLTRLGDARGAAEWIYEIGDSYTSNRALQDLVAAERWLRHGLELLPEGDSGKARFLAALGRAAWERFRAARQTERPEPELVRHLTDARRNFERAIEHESQGEYARLARHNLLYGHISYSLGDIDAALPHYRESIRYDRLTGNNFSAAKTRFNLAIALRDVGRLGEARKYAVAAFGELKSLHGPITDDLLDRSRRLVMSIELRIEEKRQRRQKRARRAVSVG